jgi:hypothetical protein
MDKIIKEFKENEYTYQLGYYFLKDGVYPRIEIFKDRELLSGGNWSNGINAGLFCFVNYFFSFAGYVNTIKEMFNGLREYSKIPEEVEKEFENIFIMCKLNNFKEI